MSDIFEFEDKARVERLVGTLHDPTATPGDVLTVQADKSIAAAPGGGVSSPVQAIYAGNPGAPVSIANGSSDNVTFDTLTSGTELLDRSSPASPTFLADGTYSILANVYATAPLTAGGYAVPGITADVTNSVQPGSLGIDTYGISVYLVAEYLAGDSCAVTMTNQDGVASRDFVLNFCYITKLA